VPSSAVPVSVIAHDEISAVEPVACACQLTVVPLSVPLAVPAKWRPPAHDAVNDPDADVADCCVGVHVKSVQLEADGMTPVDVDFQVPTSESTVAVGLLGVVVLLSYP
jgi:hypothetical protein